MLVSEFGVDCIINTGSAGGIAQELEMLDMVVCTDAVQHDFDTTAFGYKPGQIPGTDSPFFVADARLRKTALAAFSRVSTSLPSGVPSGHKMIEGRIASGDAFITDGEKRARIVSIFSPACVEMEGAAIAQVCTVNKIPFAILRSVSDLAGKDADMSYEEFSKLASRVSAQVVIAMVTELKTAG